MRFSPLFLALILIPALALAKPDTAATPAKTPAPADNAGSGINAKDVEAPAPAPNTVVLQGLNKVTGKISKFEGPDGTVLRFGTLEIVAHRCWKSNPEDTPENAALLEISELKPGEASKRIFLGWMFSSSPGLSGLEHPVYDITLLACEYRKDPEQQETKPETKPESKTQKSAKAKPAAKPAKPSN